MLLGTWLPSLFYHGELVDFEKIKSDVVHETASWEEIKESGFISKKKFMGLVFGAGIWSNDGWDGKIPED